MKEVLFGYNRVMSVLGFYTRCCLAHILEEGTELEIILRKDVPDVETRNDHGHRLYEFLKLLHAAIKNRHIEILADPDDDGEATNGRLRNSHSLF